jgi:hypothetical protein
MKNLHWGTRALVSVPIILFIWIETLNKIYLNSEEIFTAAAVPCALIYWVTRPFVKTP